jgi:hypothetical protein
MISLVLFFRKPGVTTDNPEAILKKTRANLKKVSVENSEVSQAKRNLAPEFEAMANKTP